ncbi:MAG: helicase-associated domain-containing protein [Alicyclobacillus herbarius]|uniref:DNA repair helicase XPB n=1 Tax=Alicyclobacillus herbarius TaxID=122960 RepID=UPI0023552051|nr:DNA repair helicase XPB [Alicyclobacillus herbarius]MCL6632861.1 helicase-associated domain-containing protein [Alicyclobacillus herbarius]
MSGILYVHADGTLTARADAPEYPQVQSTLRGFAELIQQLDPVHVYQIRPLSLWQAAARGMTGREVLSFLRKHTAHPLPFSFQQMVYEEMNKWGRLELCTTHQGTHVRLQGDARVLETLAKSDSLALWIENWDAQGISFSTRHRADVKRALGRLGYPVLDRTEYQTAPNLAISLRPCLRLREYQTEAVNSFFAEGEGHSGIIVLPCGAGKTVVGIAILAKLQQHTLILTPGEEAALQWKRELTRWCQADEGTIDLYRPGRAPYPITITTYQRVAARNRSGIYRNLERLTRYPWGLVIYDEVHMLPAPLFRLAAELQGARRLGLTATLVREDGLTADVFSLIGPKLYEVQWKPLEHEGYLSSVTCVEVRVPWDPHDLNSYLEASAREKHRLASENRKKVQVVKHLVRRHPEAKVLILGHYLDSLSLVSRTVGCPLLTGKTPKSRRDTLYNAFREGHVRILALSRIANMAIDLPTATVAIQVSGLFGSRQEEAQRLGRLLRPEGGSGVFYTLVTEKSVEEEKARHRQMFLVEQGYRYQMMGATEISLV